jgi:pantetheine-phosphate adenylyltransferase
MRCPSHYGDGMRRAVCPGSFDPVTNGHLDIFGRAAALFDEVVVAVGVNKSKSATSSRLFTSDERMEMIADAVSPWENVKVQGFTGLVTDFCREIGAQAIVKGLRGSGDYDYELQMAQMNAHLTEVETVFLMTDPSMSFVSSSLVKEVASFGGDVSGLVSPAVFERLTVRLAERQAGA